MLPRKEAKTLVKFFNKNDYNVRGWIPVAEMTKAEKNLFLV